METASSRLIVLPFSSGGGAFVGVSGVMGGGLAWIVMPVWAPKGAGRASLARMARIEARTNGAILTGIVIGELSSWPHRADIACAPEDITRIRGGAGGPGRPPGLDPGRSWRDRSGDLFS